MNVNNLALAL